MTCEGCGEDSGKFPKCARCGEAEALAEVARLTKELAEAKDVADRSVEAILKLDEQCERLKSRYRIVRQQLAEECDTSERLLKERDRFRAALTEQFPECASEDGCDAEEECAVCEAFGRYDS